MLGVLMEEFSNEQALRVAWMHSIVDSPLDVYNVNPQKYYGEQLNGSLTFKKATP